MNDQINQILKIVTSEQELTARRYAELKSSIDDINLKLPTLATKDQLNRVFESLSQDISALAIDSEKLKKRIDSQEKRIKKLETKVLLS
jgi:chromosome segregation ATPase